MLNNLSMISFIESIDEINSEGVCVRSNAVFKTWILLLSSHFCYFLVDEHLILPNSAIIKQ